MRFDRKVVELALPLLQASTYRIHLQRYLSRHLEVMSKPVLPTPRNVAMIDCVNHFDGTFYIFSPVTIH